MERTKFEELVTEALESVPPKFKRLLQNVAVLVEDQAPQEYFRGRGRQRSLLLGLYHGVPFKHRGPYYGNLPPDVIVIYQKPIESICSSEAEVKDKVREVVLHEVGHYFGLSDRELREIERR